jgi:hypothetical protein
MIRSIKSWKKKDEKDGEENESDLREDEFLSHLSKRSWNKRFSD